MINPILPNSIRPLTGIEPGALRPSGPQAGAGSFQNLFLDALDRVDQFRTEANQKVQSVLSGDSEDIHQVAIATQKAELAFELTQAVRNKVVQAYQEVMRMQL